MLFHSLTNHYKISKQLVTFMWLIVVNSSITIYVLRLFSVTEKKKTKTKKNWYSKYQLATGESSILLISGDPGLHDHLCCEAL